MWDSPLGQLTSGDGLGVRAPCFSTSRTPNYTTDPHGFLNESSSFPATIRRMNDEARRMKIHQ
jgi:hypothetical protein